MRKYLNTTLLFNLTVLLGLILLFCQCAHPIPVTLQPNIYGFWGGLWHGMTIPFSFVGRMFDDGIVLYSVNNNGRWYDFGYALGAGGLGFWFRLIRNSFKEDKN